MSIHIYVLSFVLWALVAYGALFSRLGKQPTDRHGAVGILAVGIAGLLTLEAIDVVRELTRAVGDISIEAKVGLE